MATVALDTGIDPWSLLHVPEHVRRAIEVVYLERKREEQAEQRRSDLRDRLRTAVGR